MCNNIAVLCRMCVLQVLRILEVLEVLQGTTRTTGTSATHTELLSYDYVVYYICDGYHHDGPITLYFKIRNGIYK